MIVLPPRYVEELRNVPDTELDSLASVVSVSGCPQGRSPSLLGRVIPHHRLICHLTNLEQDFHDQYTGIGIIHGTHLNYNVVRRILSPKLGGMMPELAAITEHSLKAVMPPCKGMA
jgi:hypothetical protein